MATSSFAKDFIVTDKQAPLWEKASAHFENKNLWTPVLNRRISEEKLTRLLESIQIILIADSMYAII